jgi:hypothetical protein
MVTRLHVPLPPSFERKKTVRPNWPYFIFWASAITGVMLLLFAIILELRSLHHMMLERL